MEIKKIKELLLDKKVEIIIVIFAMLFSAWLMFSTFSYKNGNMLIASKAWSDFGSHIPLIRSFSLGSNFPPEYPLFSGAPIKYHFLFYALVGTIEKIGIPINLALNIPSALGFMFLITMIYIFAVKLFNSKSVGVLSIIFFLFNGSLSFLNFFSKNPLSRNTLLQAVTNTNFSAFGPYDHTSIVSAFWNLNIYTNQRHLGLSYALSLLIIYLFLNFEHLSNKTSAWIISILIGLLFGLSFILNMAVFLMTAIILIIFLFFLKKERIYILSTLIISAITAFPLYKYINSIPSTYNFTFNPGYLVEHLNLFNFINYWFQNLGVHLILIPLGVVLAKRFNRKIFISFFSLFIVGNLIQFSPEMAANHKFFNYFMIIGVMFSSFVLVELWNKRDLLKPLVVALFFILILSGIIDFFPVLNDNKIILADKNEPEVQWIIKNTTPTSVFLNTQFFMDKASIAGRKIFLGWPYFAWSQGYDTNARSKLMERLLSINEKKEACVLLNTNHINYIEIVNPPDTNIPKISPLYSEKFKLLYKGSNAIYGVKESCL